MIYYGKLFDLMKKQNKNTTHIREEKIISQDTLGKLRRGTGIYDIGKKSWVFLILSGLATGASWLCYYKALQDGLASVVVPIDKLSIVVTIVFSYIVFHEKLSRKALFGLVLIIGGTLWMVFI